MDMATFGRRMRELDDRQRNGVTLVLVSASCAWSSSWVDEAITKTSKLTSKNAFVRVLFVADPMTTWSVIPELDRLAAAGVATLNLTPWHDSALQHWLDEAGFANVREGDRNRIAGVTGNWASLLKRFYQRCRTALHQWSASLEQIEHEIEASGKVEELNAEVLFGVSRREVLLALKDLAELGEASAEDLAAVNDEVTAAVAVQVLRWATQLSLVQPVGAGRFRIDSTLARMLAASAKVSP